MSRPERTVSADERFTPALGRAGLTGAYDLAIRLLTRERLWRTALLEQLAPRNGETILDVGCGTGSFALLMKDRAPGARIIVLDTDPAVLHRAEAKARKADVGIEWGEGCARTDVTVGGAFDQEVSQTRRTRRRE